MSLMDVLRGMQHGPHGQPVPRSGTGSGTGTGTGSTGTGVSPITMAILGLLAYKALKSMSPRGEPAPAGGPPPAGGGDIAMRDIPRDIEPRDVDTGRGGMPAGGGIGGLLKGALGGLLAGSAAGGVMGGGLNDLIKQMQKYGFGDAADSWVGTGPNKTIAPGDLARALSPIRSMR
jgi:hypothetical protein